MVESNASMCQCTICTQITVGMFKYIFRKSQLHGFESSRSWLWLDAKASKAHAAFLTLFTSPRSRVCIIICSRLALPGFTVSTSNTMGQIGSQLAAMTTSFRQDTSAPLKERCSISWRTLSRQRSIFKRWNCNSETSTNLATQRIEITKSDSNNLEHWDRHSQLFCWVSVCFSPFFGLQTGFASFIICSQRSTTSSRGAGVQSTIKTSKRLQKSQTVNLKVWSIQND